MIEHSVVSKMRKIDLTWNTLVSLRVGFPYKFDKLLQRLNFKFRILNPNESSGNPFKTEPGLIFMCMPHDFDLHSDYINIKND